jgi:hypothetical protein
MLVLKQYLPIGKYCLCTIVYNISCFDGEINLKVDWVIVVLRPFDSKRLGLKLKNAVTNIENYMISTFSGKKSCKWHIELEKNKKFCDEGDSRVR